MTSTEASINLGPTLGVAFVGVICAAVFHGITTLQTIFYFSNYFDDHYLLKILVATVWILDTISLSMVSYSMYIYLIKDFLNPLALEQINWGMGAEPAVSCTIAFIVHLFLLHRTYKLNRNSAPFAIAMAMLAIVNAGLGYYSVCLDATGHAWSKNLEDVRWVTISALSMAIFLNTAITSAICLLLYKNRTGFQNTDKMINMITAYTISSALLPLLVTIAILIAGVAYDHTLANEAFNVLVSKAYANAFMATLNGRQTISNSTHCSTLEWRRPRSESARAPPVDGNAGTDKNKPLEAQSYAAGPRGPFFHSLSSESRSSAMSAVTSETISHV